MRGQTFLGYVRSLHTHLGSGNAGRNILRWSSVAMLLSLGSGLYLWWPIKQVRVRGKWGTTRLWRDLHNTVGIFSLLPLAILATSGAVLGFEDQLAPLIYKLARSHPTRMERKAVQPHQQSSPPITPDDAVRIARGFLPGTDPYRVQMPAYGGVYQIALVSPHSRLAADRDVVVLDPSDGSLLSLSRSSDLSQGDRILAANEAIHTGAIFGMPSRIAASLASIMVVAQMLTGIVAWFYRRRLIPSAAGISKAGILS